MLSKKDKKWIEDVCKRYMVKEITMEKCARGPGEPEKKIETCKVNVLDVMIEYLPRVEAALRGVQSAANKSRNRSIEAKEGVEAIGKILLDLEDEIKIMGRFVIAMRESGLLEQLEKIALIEHKDERALIDASDTE